MISVSLVHVLVGMTIASSIAVLIVGALRKPLRRIAGPRSAYWVWLLLPTTALAVFLPAPTYPQRTLPGAVSEVLSNTAVTVGVSGISANYLKIGLATWLPTRLRPIPGQHETGPGWCSVQ
jgi:beta-lactamase regulating signal transducer with metallopeptidase domain